METVSRVVDPVFSEHRYNSAFMGLKPLKDQIALGVEMFGLSGGPTRAFIEGLEEKNPHPHGFEGWVAVPKMEKVAAKFFPNVFTQSEKDRLGLEYVLKKIERYIPVNNQLTYMRNLELRRSDRSAQAFDIMSRGQPGDFLVFPAQLGYKYRGYSPRKTFAGFATNRFYSGEFEIDAFSGACILLTHPDRLRNSKDLGMICMGSEVLDTNPLLIEKLGERRWNPLYFYGDGFYQRDEIGFASMTSCFAHELYGAATGLLV